MDYVSKLNIIFRGVTNTGKGAWAPSSRLSNEDEIKCDQNNSIFLEEEEIVDLDDELGDIQPDLISRLHHHLLINLAVALAELWSMYGYA